MYTFFVHTNQLLTPVRFRLAQENMKNDRGFSSQGIFKFYHKVGGKSRNFLTWKSGSLHQDLLFLPISNMTHFGKKK